MSPIVATVEAIESAGNLNIVTFRAGSSLLKMVSLELDKKVVPGRKVRLSCKPTSVALAKPAKKEACMLEGLSYANQIHAKILSIEKGDLLGSIRVKWDDWILEALVLKASVERMHLEEGEEIVALLKASDLSILEVLDD